MILLPLRLVCTCLLVYCIDIKKSIRRKVSNPGKLGRMKAAGDCQVKDKNRSTTHQRETLPPPPPVWRRPQSRCQPLLQSQKCFPPLSLIYMLCYFVAMNKTQQLKWNEDKHTYCYRQLNIFYNRTWFLLLGLSTAVSVVAVSADWPRKPHGFI